jgi:alanine racemase
VCAAVEAGLTLSISSLDGLRRLVEAATGRPDGRSAAFHLEVDTGMGRAGFDPSAVARWAAAAHEAHAAGVRWEGTFTHLHSADEGERTVDEQWRRFQDVLAAAAPPPGSFVHVLNSAGALRCPRYAADLVRPGIFLYGGGAGEGLPEPEVVASVRARVVHVRDAPAGSTVGYGATYRAGRDERWATLAIGYGDGLPRSLGNRGSALLRGRRVPIVGRISMDVTVVDITDVPGVETGEVATLVGADGGAHITVDEVAGLAGTISYEVLTGFTPRVPRIWLDDDSRD